MQYKEQAEAKSVLSVQPAAAATAKIHSVSIIYY